MARSKNRSQKPEADAPTSSRRGSRPKSQELRFSQINAIMAAAGLVTLALGYYLLAQGSITAAPLLLVLGYVVLIPLAIIL